MEEMSERISTDIFTFSGTGNSLVLAEAIAAELGGGNVRLITKDLLAAKQLISRADRVGFVYPVYFMNMPWPVKTVMERLVLTGACRLFAVATCARMEGLAVEEAEILWQERGRRLEWGLWSICRATASSFPLSLRKGKGGWPGLQAGLPTWRV